MSSSSDNKKRKTEAFSSVLFSVLEPKKLKAIEIKRWNVAQVLEVLQKEVGLDDDDLKQINGLKGGHLIAAIKAYKRDISSNETPNTAYQKIISFLMTIERVVTGIYVAESIANWLIEHFIDSESITEIQYKPDDYEETDGDEINRKYIYKSQFQQEELLFFQELEQYNLKDLSTPFSKTLDPLSFKLQHREQTIEEIVKVGSKHLEVYPLANKGKQQINFFIAKGGSGSGKTRILTEIPNIFRGHSGQELDTIFENTKIIYFNFANGFSLDSTDRDKRSISMIVSRIVYAAFKRPNELAQKTPPSENDLFFYEVLRIISKKLHATYGETNRQQILLFPAFGGTFVEFDVKMEPTQYTPAPLALPSLRPIDIEAIMNDMGLSELYTGNYREFWNAIGIVPRHLEWALGNDGKQLKSLIVLNDETVRTIIYANVVNIVKKQYHNNLYDDYFGELALKTISGLKYNKDQRLNEYISEGKVYDDGFIGIPLVVIDILATKMEYIPKCVVSDFITASNKSLWEKFEELCIKTMTARFNVLYTINRSEKVQFSELFKGAHFKTDLGYMSLKTTNSSWFKYECLETFLSSNSKEENEGIISPFCLKKAKQNQDDVDGVLCTLRNASINEQILFVTQNKFQYEDSESRTLEPADLIKFYKKAVRTTFKESKTFVIIFTNKTITKKTQEMVIEGLVSKKTKKDPQQKVTVDTEKLILVSGDCFCNFFHPYISNVLAKKHKSKKDKNKCK
ncbi:hypothetical protein ABK040_007390 [Willaertia magna]